LRSQACAPPYLSNAVPRHEERSVDVYNIESYNNIDAIYKRFTNGNYSSSLVSDPGGMEAAPGCRIQRYSRLVEINDSIGIKINN